MANRKRHPNPFLRFALLASSGSHLILGSNRGDLVVWWSTAAAPGGARSFLQAVSTVTEEAPTPLRVVQMEGLVITFETRPIYCLLFRFGS